MKQPGQSDTTDYMAAAGCFCLASRQAARKITRLYDSYMQQAGIRVTQFTILSQLMLRGEMPIGKLAGILGMERTTLTRNLAPLEQQNWITINAGDDPRARMIGITAQGRGIVRRSFSCLVEGAGAGRKTARRGRRGGAEALGYPESGLRRTGCLRPKSRSNSNRCNYT